jgi:hypothetical protein
MCRFQFRNVGQSLILLGDHPGNARFYSRFHRLPVTYLLNTALRSIRRDTIIPADSIFLARPKPQHVGVLADSSSGGSYAPGMDV